MSYLEQFISVLAGMVQSFELKMIGSGLFVAYSFLFSVELWEVMVALAVLIFFDMVTGIWASKISGEEIKSSKVCRTAFKLAVYGLLVSSGHLTDLVVGLPPGWIGAETAMLGFLAATELVSVLENSGRMGFGVPRKLLNQLHKYTD